MKAPYTPNSLSVDWQAVRSATEALCRPLQVEDYVAQSMPDASPAKWHLAHTTWFFEQFLLADQPGYEPFDPQFGYLFNSYYVTIGERHTRAERGLLTRPTVHEVFRYRAHVDRHLQQLVSAADEAQLARLEPLLIVGMHHEQQHQELLLTDLKHLFWKNPLRPAYAQVAQAPPQPAPPHRWIDYPGGLVSIGHPGAGFAYDNESPRHQVYLQPYSLGSRLVTNGELIEFIGDGGYNTPELWLSDGWAACQSQGWQCPLYWEQRDGCWWQFTLTGMRELDPDEPACHLSYYEADAFARWSGARLPLEAEWEVAATDSPLEGSFVESHNWHPARAPRAPGLGQMFGQLWQWTASPYTPYPGFRPAQGALGEYNGKFMCNQFVLRGGSCATPRSHIRRSYRNFFPPQARWQFSGLRLARDL